MCSSDLGYLIGLAVEYFLHHDSVPPEFRLFVIVGFLGGLTTFSSFSSEAVQLLLENELGWAFLLVATQDRGSTPKHPHLRGSWSPDGDVHSGAGGRLMMTSLAVLTLEVYYRHLPLYRRDEAKFAGN